MIILIILMILFYDVITTILIIHDYTLLLWYTIFILCIIINIMIINIIILLLLLILLLILLLLLLLLLLLFLSFRHFPRQTDSLNILKQSPLDLSLLEALVCIELNFWNYYCFQVFELVIFKRPFKLFCKILRLNKMTKLRSWTKYCLNFNSQPSQAQIMRIFKYSFRTVWLSN